MTGIERFEEDIYVDAAIYRHDENGTARCAAGRRSRYGEQIGAHIAEAFRSLVGWPWSRHALMGQPEIYAII